MNETDKLIKDQFNRLPETLQKAIEVVPWKSAIKDIVLMNKLPTEQFGNVERETMFILYGFESPDDYIVNLMRETEISEKTAITIADAVNEQIFKPITLKIEEFDKPKAPITAPEIPQVPPANLPMVEKGEVAHEVKPQAADSGFKINDLGMDKPKQEPTAQPVEPLTSAPEIKAEKPNPPTSYTGGKDPYREPLA